MNDWGNMTDRRRNKQDPIGNPAIFHRKKSYKSSGIWMDEMIDRARRHTGDNSVRRSKSAGSLSLGNTPKTSNAVPSNRPDIWFNKMGYCNTPHLLKKKKDESIQPLNVSIKEKEESFVRAIETPNNNYIKTVELYQDDGAKNTSEKKRSMNISYSMIQNNKN